MVGCGATMVGCAATTSCIAVVLVGVLWSTHPPECIEHKATKEMATAIRQGCGFVHDGTLCTYDGCFHSPDIVRIGPMEHRTLTHSLADRMVPAYVVIEHRVTPTAWKLYNATGVRAVECIVAHQRIFGTIHPTQYAV